MSSQPHEPEPYQAGASALEQEYRKATLDYARRPRSPKMPFKKLSLCLIGLSLVIQLAPGASRQDGLQNPGFETMLPGNWTTHVYGAQPQISLDPSGAKEGRQSLRVESR